MRKALLKMTFCSLVALFGLCATGCQSGTQSRLISPTGLMNRLNFTNSAPQGQFEPPIEVDAQ